MKGKTLLIHFKSYRITETLIFTGVSVCQKIKANSYQCMSKTNQ